MRNFFANDPLLEQLKEVELVGSNFLGFGFYSTRKLAAKIVEERDTHLLNRVLALMNKQRENSFQSVKILLFIHSLASCNMQIQNEFLKETLNGFINKTLENEQINFSRIRKNRTRVNSFDKTITWIKERFSTSKDKKVGRETKNDKNKSVSIVTVLKDKNTMGSETLRDITQKEKQMEKKRHSRTDSNHEMQNGKQEMLICNIIKPYAAFLQKLIFANLNFVQLANTPLESVEMWKIINLLKMLYCICSSFPIMLRYYSKDFYEMIVILFLAIDSETKILYPLLSVTLNKRIQIVNEQLMRIFQKEESRRVTVQLKQITEKHNLKELRQFLEEISEINEQIINLYSGKYTYEMITKKGLRSPKLLNDQKQISLIYEALKMVQKVEVRERKSHSKQKSLSFLTPQAVNNLCELKTVRINRVPTFAQKKQKLIGVSCSDSVTPRINQIDKKQNMNSFTSNFENFLYDENSSNQNSKNQSEKEKVFRRMRLQTTNRGVHLQSGGTAK